MTLLVGLTGSIGTGKSTTAAMFADLGCAVWDADAAVHRLYARGGAAVAAIGAAFPDAVENGAVSRPALRRIIAADPSALRRIEQIVHPLVASDRAAFVAGTTADIAVLDIPLLFETGAEEWLDTTVTVTIDPQTRRQRVLDRGTMTPAEFDAILAKQMPDAEKRARAEFVIETDTLEHARAQVHSVVETLKNRLPHA